VLEALTAAHFTGHVFRSVGSFHLPSAGVRHLHPGRHFVVDRGFAPLIGG
jgi:hypothetical protein